MELLLITVLSLGAVIGGGLILLVGAVVLARTSSTAVAVETTASVAADAFSETLDMPAARSSEENVIIDLAYEREAVSRWYPRADDTPAIPQILAERLDELKAAKLTPPTPLPMPVPPPGLEPIPELEPTELMIDRPEWAQSWQHAG